MTTSNQVMFPNYNPAISRDNSRLSQVKTVEKHQILEKTGNDVFLILHDFETKTESKISKFLGRIKEKYHDQVEESEYFQAMNKYNLVDIFNEIHDNLYYVGNNKAQLELIEKFDISSFERLYQIIDTIGMSHSLHWKIIDMPVNKFSLLTQYIEHYNAKYFSQEDYLLMAQDLEYNNLEGLYSGLNALNLAEGITCIDFNYTDTVNILMFTHQYIIKNIDSTDTLSNRDLKIIYENYYDGAIASKKHSYSSLKRLLSLFGYDIQETDTELKVA